MVSLDFHRNFHLKQFNTFGIDAIAEQLVVVQSVAALLAVVKANSLTVRVLGGGSNVLLTGDLPGLIIKNEIGGIEILLEDDLQVLVKVGGGVNWHDFVLWAVGQGLGGVENLSLIPGTVGAAPIQNIGAYGVELKDVFHSLDAVDLRTGEPRHFNLKQCQFGYRDSIFKKELKGQACIVHVCFSLRKKPILNTAYGDIQKTLAEMGIEEPSIRDVSNAVIRIRQSKLPNPDEIGNAGSFFKNPVLEPADFHRFIVEFPDSPHYPQPNGQVKVPAGWLIEQAGWKGHREGGAGCHSKQALVLVNYGTAIGTEILDLARKIQKSVREKFGIEISPEVNIW